MINHNIACLMRPPAPAPAAPAAPASGLKCAAASIAFALLWLDTGAHASVGCSNANIVAPPPSLAATTVPTRRLSLATGAKLQKQRAEALARTQPAANLSLGQR